ncbi:unnamed protein product [Calypogeia fissa]
MKICVEEGEVDPSRMVLEFCRTIFGCNKGKQQKAVSASGIDRGPEVRVVDRVTVLRVPANPPSEQGSHAQPSQIRDVDTVPATPLVYQSRGKKRPTNPASRSGSRKKVALEKVPTPLESVVIASQASREKCQEDLVDRCAVKNTMMLVDIDQIYPRIKDKNVKLPQY